MCFYAKSETSGPSSPISMPSLDSQTSEHVSNTSTTPVIKKPELQSVPAIHTPRRPTSPQRKSSHGSFYSDISSETDHEHSHQGIAPPSGNLETTPTARTTLTASDEQKCQVSNKAKAQASSAGEVGSAWLLHLSNESEATEKETFRVAEMSSLACCLVWEGHEVWRSS